MSILDLVVHYAVPSGGVGGQGSIQLHTTWASTVYRLARELASAPTGSKWNVAWLTCGLAYKLIPIWFELAYSYVDLGRDKPACADLRRNDSTMSSNSRTSRMI